MRGVCICVSVCSVVRARSHVCVLRAHSHVCVVCVCFCVQCCARTFTCVRGVCVFLCAVLCAHVHMCAWCVCAHTCVNVCDVCIDYVSGQIFPGGYFRRNVSGEILLLRGIVSCML